MMHKGGSEVRLKNRCFSRLAAYGCGATFVRKNTVALEVGMLIFLGNGTNIMTAKKITPDMGWGSADF